MGLPKWTWPNWRDAPEGTRFVNNRTGRRGTLVGASPNRNNGARVRWDDRGMFPGEGQVVNLVAPAREARPLTPEELAEEAST
jgi:hypothetical protein